MKVFWIFLICTLLGFESYAFMYPGYRRVLPGIILYKYKSCSHDCWNWSFLNQHDAYRCPKACRTY